MSFHEKSIVQSLLDYRRAMAQPEDSQNNYHRILRLAKEREMELCVEIEEKDATITEFKSMIQRREEENRVFSKRISELIENEQLICDLRRTIAQLTDDNGVFQASTTISELSKKIEDQSDQLNQQEKLLGSTLEIERALAGKEAIISDLRNELQRQTNQIDSARRVTEENLRLGRVVTELEDRVMRMDFDLNEARQAIRKERREQDEEVGKLRSQVAELSMLKSQLPNGLEHGSVAMERRDSDQLRIQDLEKDLKMRLDEIAELKGAVFEKGQLVSELETSLKVQRWEVGGEVENFNRNLESANAQIRELQKTKNEFSIDLHSAAETFRRARNTIRKFVDENGPSDNSPYENSRDEGFKLMATVAELSGKFSAEKSYLDTSKKMQQQKAASIQSRLEDELSSALETINSHTRAISLLKEENKRLRSQDVPSSGVSIAEMEKNMSNQRAMYESEINILRSEISTLASQNRALQNLNGKNKNFADASSDLRHTHTLTLLKSSIERQQELSDEIISLQKRHSAEILALRETHRKELDFHVDLSARAAAEISRHEFAVLQQTEFSTKLKLALAETAEITVQRDKLEKVLRERDEALREMENRLSEIHERNLIQRQDFSAEISAEKHWNMELSEQMRQTENFRKNIEIFAAEISGNIFQVEKLARGVLSQLKNRETETASAVEALSELKRHLVILEDDLAQYKTLGRAVDVYKNQEGELAAKLESLQAQSQEERAAAQRRITELNGQLAEIFALNKNLTVQIVNGEGMCARLSEELMSSERERLACEGRERQLRMDLSRAHLHLQSLQSEVGEMTDKVREGHREGGVAARLQDEINELKQQLSRDSALTKIELREKLDEKEKEIQILKARQTETVREGELRQFELQSTIVSLTTTLAQLRSELEFALAHLNEKHIVLIQNQDQISSAKSAREEAQSKLQSAQSQIALLTEKLSELEKEEGQIDSQRSVLIHANSVLNEKITSLESERRDREDKISRLEAETEDLRQRFKTRSEEVTGFETEVSQNVDVFSRRVVELQGQVAMREEHVAALEREMAELQVKNQDLAREIERKTVVEAGYIQEIETMAENNRNLKFEFDRERYKLLGELESARAETARTSEMISAVEAQNNEKGSKIQTLENRIFQMEGQASVAKHREAENMKFEKDTWEERGQILAQIDSLRRENEFLRSEHSLSRNNHTAQQRAGESAKDSFAKGLDTEINRKSTVQFEGTELISTRASFIVDSSSVHSSPESVASRAPEQTPKPTRGTTRFFSPLLEPEFKSPSQPHLLTHGDEAATPVSVENDTGALKRKNDILVQEMQKFKEAQAGKMQSLRSQLMQAESRANDLELEIVKLRTRRGRGDEVDGASGRMDQLALENRELQEALDRNIILLQKSEDHFYTAQGKIAKLERQLSLLNSENLRLLAWSERDGVPSDETQLRVHRLSVELSRAQKEASTLSTKLRVLRKRVSRILVHQSRNALLRQAISLWISNVQQQKKTTRVGSPSQTKNLPRVISRTPPQRERPVVIL